MLLAATLTLVFAGGPLPKLADALAKAHGAPVAILAGSAEDYAPLSTETDDPFTFGNRVHRLAGIRAPKDGTGYAPAGWPAYMRPSSRFARDPGLWKGVRFDTWEVERTGDKVKVGRAGSGILPVSDLERTDFGKPVKVPEFYGRAMVGVSTGTWEPRQLLTSIAQAIGAHLFENASAFEFKLNPKVFRTRLVQAMGEEIARLEKSDFDPVHLAQAQLVKATVEVLSDAQIEAFAKGGNEAIALDVAQGSPLAMRCMRYLTAYANRGDIANMSAKEFRAIVERMDLSRGIKLRLNTSGISVAIRAYDKTASNGAIEL